MRRQAASRSFQSPTLVGFPFQLFVDREEMLDLPQHMARHVIERLADGPCDGLERFEGHASRRVQAQRLCDGMLAGMSPHASNHLTKTSSPHGD
jgi:hypothetical protein